MIINLYYCMIYILVVVLKEILGWFLRMIIVYKNDVYR